MRFDGYAGTLREVDFDLAARSIAHALGGEVERGQARRRYGEVLDINLEGRQAAWVGWDRGNGTVYFEGKGETTPDLAKAVRRHFKGHTVARADVCEDYDAPGAFERLVGLVRECKGPRVDAGFVRLPDDPDKGRTWSAGVRGAVGMIRVYESGKMRERLHLGRPNLARLELECRPHYAEQKVAAASMSPADFWGFTAWTHRVGEAITQVDLARYEGSVRRTTEHKTTLYIARTFRRHLEGLLEREGGDQAAVMQVFARVWAEDDQAAQSMSLHRRH
jgi:hypothetical protein